MATKYDRIAADIRRKIRAGECQPGTQLRSETALMEDYRVSLPTMRRALDLLEAEGLIEKRHGIGNFVRTRRQLVRRTAERYQWEKDRVSSTREAAQDRRDRARHRPDHARPQVPRRVQRNRG